MLVALYLTTLPAPRIYGVEVARVLDKDDLHAAVVKADVLITDTSFDTKFLPIIKCCCVLKTAESGAFAESNGFDCIEATGIAEWFKRVLKVDVTRKSRGGIAASSTAAVTSKAKETDESRFKAMYEGLVSELKKTDLYANIDIKDAKTYDILMQTMRGSLRKADSLTVELRAAQTKLTEVESKLAKLETESVSINSDMAVILAGLTKSTAEWSDMLTTISRLTQEAESTEYCGVTVKAKAAYGLAQKLSSVVAANEIRSIGSVLREFLSCLGSITVELAQIGTNASTEFLKAQSTTHQTSITKANMERELKQAHLLLEQERINCSNITQQLSQITAKHNQQLQQIAELENQLLLSDGASISVLQEQIRTLRADLQLKNEKILRMEELNSTDSSENATLSPEVSAGIIRQLRSQVASLKLERDRATSELMKAKQAAVRETERAETLTNSARSLSQVAYRGAQVSPLPQFKYTAKALIIPVFGNGSTGISSTAVSLAKMLGVNSRTVLLDYDLVATDLEGRFRESINPLVKLDGESKITGKSSAMGLFVDKGKDFFINHYAELVIRIDSNKAGILDYLPGFYAKPDLFMLTQADYTTLLNYLGARYDYIIVDAGKIGCSEIGDQIIRNLCLCSFCSLIVTDASKEKVRAMRLKLNDVFGSDLRGFIEHCVWVTNRASKHIDLSSFTAPAKNVTLPILPEMVGAYDSFHITNTARHEFNKVARAIVGV